MNYEKVAKIFYFFEQKLLRNGEMHAPLPCTKLEEKFMGSIERKKSQKCSCRLNAGCLGRLFTKESKKVKNIFLTVNYR